MIIDKNGWVIKCDRCGLVNDESHRDDGSPLGLPRCGCAACVESEKAFDIRRYWDGVIFKGVNSAGVGWGFQDLCSRCAIEITPLIWRLRDIKELNIFNYRLQKAINERIKDNRAA